jgi:predicted nuclease of predicted toxin-antitoxin system
MKFLVDRCVGATLARWLREKGHDVREARGSGPDPGDEELLAQALAEGRVLVTLDKDFGALVFGQGASHCGLVRLPDVPAAQRIALFERLLAAHEKDMSEGAVLTVRGDRVRVSRPEP